MRIVLHRFSRVALRLSLVAPLLTAILSAQTDTAGLFGLVRDATGGAVVNSKVKLHSRATAAVREQTTDGRGLYQFEVLPPGEYELTVEAAGFKQFRDSQVRVQVADISRLNVQLEIGSASEFIEVEGRRTALERLFRLFVLNCALRNGDAHLKNFGIIYDEVVGPARLAPVYDLVFGAVFDQVSRELVTEVATCFRLD